MAAGPGLSWSGLTTGLSRWAMKENGTWGGQERLCWNGPAGDCRPASIDTDTGGHGKGGR